jgi:hypothetical protein
MTTGREPLPVAELEKSDYSSPAFDSRPALSSLGSAAKKRKPVIVNREKQNESQYSFFLVQCFSVYGLRFTIYGFLLFSRGRWRRPPVLMPGSQLSFLISRQNSANLRHHLRSGHS